MGIRLEACKQVASVILDLKYRNIQFK